MRKVLSLLVVLFMCSTITISGQTGNTDDGVITAGPKLKLTPENNFFNPRFTKVTPNPARTDAEIEFFNPTNAKHRLDVYNIIGNKLESYTNDGSNTFNIDVTEYNAGVYFYKIINDKDHVATGRLIVRK